MKGLIIRIGKQMVNDKRSLALIFVIPLVIMTFISLLLGDRDVTMRVTIYGGNDTVKNYFAQECELVEEYADRTPEEMLEEKDTDVCIIFGAETKIYLYEPNSAYMNVINGILKDMQNDTTVQADTEILYLNGDHLTSTFEQLAYAMLGILAFFLVFLIAGVSFVHERTLGTLERLMMTPIKRSEVVLGTTLGFGIFGILQSVLILVFTIQVLGVDFTGDYFGAILIMILIALTAVSMGIFVSIFANSEFQVFQFIPVIIVPQIFLSGIFPLDGLPYHIEKLKYITPIYYGCMGLKKLLVYGGNLYDVKWEISILCVYIVVFYMLNVVNLKKYRR